MSLFYFAYGSNMSPQRLQARVPSATPLGMMQLKAHQLCFHKHSRVDGSAKCDAWYTGNPADAVYGLLYRMAAADRPRLDYYEGLGRGYEVKNVLLAPDGEGRVEAFLYVATDIEPGLQPYDWYKEHVLRGGRYAGLPAEYMAAIETVAACPDPDPERQQHELAIYLDRGPCPPPSAKACYFCRKPLSKGRGQKAPQCGGKS